MFNLTEALTGTLPRIKNASKAYRKVLNLKIGEYIDVLKTEIPASYPSVIPITYSIRKKYGHLFYVAELENNNGWRVIRVESLEVLKTLPNFRTKFHVMESPTPTKNHNFSDADLAQLIDQKIDLATRDSADLIPRGVTALRLANLQAANDAFKIMPSDEELEGDVGVAVTAKNTARSDIESRIGNVRTMAQNIFGEDSAEYRGFGFKGMISQTDNELSRISKVVYKGAVKYQIQLEPEGCTPAFLALMEAEVTAFDQSIDDVKAAEKLRLEGTANRIKAGNELYTEVDKICNTAKDVYRETNPTKYEEYLIYPTPSGSRTATRSGNLNAGQIVNINTENMEPTAQTKVFLQAENTPLRFYSSSVPAGAETGGHVDVLANAQTEYTFDEFNTLLAFDATNQYLNVENKGAGPGKYRLRLTNLE